MAKRRQRTRPEERMDLMRAVVEEVRAHGRAVLRDREGLLARLAARARLSPERVRELAPECLELCRIVLSKLREREGG